VRAITGLTSPSSDTITPDRAEFGRLAAEYNVVPVWREYVADQITPIAAFSRLSGPDRPGFLLESAENGESWGRWSFVGRQAASMLRAEGGEVVVTGEPLPDSVRLDDGILATIEDVLAHYRSPELDRLPPMHGGLVGYLGYDVVREIETLPSPPEDDLEYPDALLQLVGDMVAIDHFRQRLVLISNAFIPAGATEFDLDILYSRAQGRLKKMAVDIARPASEPLTDPPAADDEPPEVTSTMGGDGYTRAVEVAKEHILDGDIFQVVLAQRFDFDLDADPFDVYRVLRQVNPSPYMYFFRTNRVSLVGSSPEPLVQLIDGRVISRPIAGTRRRGATDEEDRRLAAELVEHPKELAEHVMLVDLARNDVGRVVTFGTEQVDEMMTLERYSHVMHLTSQVSGELAPGLTAVDVLRATLPAGTVSGAPKVRAMEIIDELEPVRRGPYAGVVGYFDFSGSLDTAIAIRTMVVGPRGRASVQAGAGIVADSEPEHEDLECHNKARALLAAVPAARRMSALRMEYRRAEAMGMHRYSAMCLRETVARAPYERDGLIVHGADAASFLHGQLTQDIEGLPERGSVWSLLLEPDGKFVALLRVSRLGTHHFGIDTDPGQGPAVVERLRRFLIRVDCEVTDSDTSVMQALRGPATDTVLLPPNQRGPDFIESWVGWPGVPGLDLAFDVRGLPGDLPHASADDLEALRIEAGWPRSGVDLGPGDIPADAGAACIDATVCFTKGCYTGQELVERMDARGARSPRPLRGLILNEQTEVPPAGAEVVLGGEVVGTVTSASYAVWRDAPVALARVARTVEPSCVGLVRWPGGEAGARLVPLPFAPVPSFDRVPSI
jgi:anthranilate synthase component 1